MQCQFGGEIAWSWTRTLRSCSVFVVGVLLLVWQLKSLLRPQAEDGRIYLLFPYTV